MNDYNRGALPDPCLRLDFGFGEQWKSVELGDGTGYVRLADYEKVAGENDRLRGLVKRMYPFVDAYMETLPNMWIDGTEGFDIARAVQELEIEAD